MTSYCHCLPLKGAGTCAKHALKPPPATERDLAHQMVSIAIREGVLIPPSTCELCPSKQGDWRTWVIHAHHEDYGRPLDVIWLCGPCHRRVHTAHGGLPGYLVWLRAQLTNAERLHERFYQPAA